MDTIKWTSKIAVPIWLVVNAASLMLCNEPGIDWMVYAVRMVVVNGITFAAWFVFLALSLLFTVAVQEREEEAEHTVTLWETQTLAKTYHETAKYHPLCAKLGIDVNVASGNKLAVSVYMLEKTDDPKVVRRHFFAHFYYRCSKYIYLGPDLFHKHALNVMENCYRGKFLDKVFKDSKYNETKFGATLKGFMDSFDVEKVIAPEELVEGTTVVEI